MRTNVIHRMDCIEGMQTEIDPGSIDIIVTSPPYNIGVKYNLHYDRMPFADYLDWMEEFGGQCASVLKQNGSLFFNIGDKASDEFRAFEVAQRISKSLRLQNTVHWVKSIAVPEHSINLGHFKPVNSRRYLNNCHEYIFHFTKTKSVSLDRLAIGVPYADKTNIHRWKHGQSNGDRRDRGNIWFIPYDTVRSSKEHPAAFPKKLPEMCLRLHGFSQSTIVLDPFAGSGTSCVVAQELGCRYIGFEIDEQYHRLAIEKLNPRMPVTVRVGNNRHRSWDCWR